MKYKLKTGRTLLVGFAFFLICTFWQAYDTIIPKILTDRFGMDQLGSGFIMALDNILALFMLPMFGTFSDKCKHKWGKRKPFVFYGTVVAIAALMLLTVSDAAQLKIISDATEIDDENYNPKVVESMRIVYNEFGNETLKTPEGDEFTLAGLYTEDEYVNIHSWIYECKVNVTKFKATLVADSGGILDVEKKDGKRHFVTYGQDENGNIRFWFRDTVEENKNKLIIDKEIGPVIKVTDKAGQTYDLDLRQILDGSSKNSIASEFKKQTNTVFINYVSPARQAKIASMTKKSPVHEVFFIIILLVLLVAMSTFRSPAVALMPDVTIKPLRSKANAIINLMGTIGGMCVLVLGMGFAFNNSAIKNTYRPYVGFFGAVAGIMALALVIFMLFVKEPAWAADMKRETEEYGIDDTPDESETGKGGKLSKSELLSLILILASVALWYFGYNAVTSKYSVYATNVLDLDYSTTLLVANAAALISYLPVGMITAKVGRKKTILAGVVMLTLSFFVMSFMRVDSPAIVMNVMFALAGIGWATINVNSFPMVVELSKNSDVGKYTGYYYAASMAAQALTPLLSGFVMKIFADTWLFPYATVFVALAFVTMFFVKHGDSKPDLPEDKLEAFAGSDD